MSDRSVHTKCRPRKIRKCSYLIELTKSIVHTRIEYCEYKRIEYSWQSNQNKLSYMTPKNLVSQEFVAKGVCFIPSEHKVNAGVCTRLSNSLCCQICGFKLLGCLLCLFRTENQRFLISFESIERAFQRKLSPGS
jgi:hypothetical protein